MGPVTNSRRAAGRAWPENCDYRDALQHPGLCLSPGLVPPGGDMRRNRAGQPVIWPGGFGAVFQYVRPDGGAVALKVFTKPNPERGERFRAVAAHLATLGPDRPPGLVGFGYAPGGIRVNGGWFPVQTMDWVKGETLGEWFAEAMGRGRADAVRDVAGRFARLVADFRRARIAHGDLQHDNVMVVGGDLRLVDYDGMVVPAIEGRPQFEIGKEAYQHPRRAELPLGPAVDSFAAWLILIALRAAAADPGLFDRYYVRPKNENLLFTPDDLRAPRESRLWAELVGFKADPEVRTWAAALRVALDGPPERVPPFDLDPWGHFRDLVRVRDWTGAADVGGRLARAGATTPADLRGKPDEARDRVAALAQAEKAPPDDPRAAVRATPNPALLDDWPAAAAAAARRRKAADQVARLDRLKAAVAAVRPGPGQDGRKLVELWDGSRKDLTGVREAAGYGQEAEGWRPRVAAADAFRAALAARPPKAEREASWVVEAAADRVGPAELVVRLTGARAEARKTVDIAARPAEVHKVLVTGRPAAGGAFRVTAQVLFPAAGATARIDLPPGLRLADGAAAEAPLAAGPAAQASWVVRADRDAAGPRTVTVRLSPDGKEGAAGVEVGPPARELTVRLGRDEPAVRGVPFWVVADVTNPAPGEAAEIALPAGFRLAPGHDRRRPLADKGGYGRAAWAVVADAAAADAAELAVTAPGLGPRAVPVRCSRSLVK